MKKVYLLGAMFFGLTALAQRTSNSYNFGQNVAESNVKNHVSVQSQVRPTENNDRALNILWEEDFSGATGLTTSQGTWVTGGTNASYWTIGTTHPLASFGWTHALTGSFLRWDSYNPNSAEVDFASTAVDGEIVSPTMDFSTATNGAVLEFKVETMYCCNFSEKPFYIYVSNNDGSTWSAPIAIDFGVGRNEATEDIEHPMTFAVDISAYTTLTSTTKLKFQWDGVAFDGNSQANTHYFWLIDDIVVYEIPDYEIVHEKLWLGDIINSFEYGSYSENQNPGNLTVQSSVKNLGLNAPTNFVQRVVITNSGGTEVYNETGGTLASGATLPSATSDIMTFETGFNINTAPVDTYTVTVTLEHDNTDEILTNDTRIRNFEKTELLYGHTDLDQTLIQQQPGGSTDLDNYIISSYFEVFASEVLYGVDVFIAPNTVVTAGLEVDIMIYEDNGTDIVLVSGPYTYDLTSAMVGDWYSFSTFAHKNKNDGDGIIGYELDPTKLYVIGMSVKNGDNVWVGGNSFDDDNSGLVFTPNSSGVDTWFLAGFEPAIRLNFDMALGLEDKTENNNFSVSQNMPNPFTDNTIITYNLNETANVNLEIVDVTGKIVATFDQGTRGAGEHTITINGSELAEGVYFYTFTAGEYKVTKRMVVNK